MKKRVKMKMKRTRQQRRIEDCRMESVGGNEGEERVRG